jgi:hypothetical protein
MVTCIVPPPHPNPASYIHIDFVVHPPGCGRSVTCFWGYGAHRARLRCPYDVSDDMCERGVPESALNLSSTSYPDHARCGERNQQRKSPTAEPVIEPVTSWLVVKSSDHQATRLVWSLVLSNQDIEGRVGKLQLREGHIFFKYSFECLRGKELN